MEMLRSWNGESHQLLIAALKQFGLAPSAVSLIKYEALTPDSFIWFLGIDGTNYCLYAEDYVPSHEHVLNVIHDNLPSWVHNEKYKLVEVVDRQKWEEASPVKSASTYKPPEKPEEFMKFATTSGFDFVFLAKSHSKPKTNLD